MARPKSATTLALEPIAAKSGLGIKHLRELHRQGGMPISSTQAALNWLAQRPDASPAASSVETLRQERIKLTRAQVQKAELELAIRRGEFVARVECEEHGARIGQAMKSAMLALEHDLPGDCIGQTISQTAPKIRERIRLILTLLADETSAFWKQHKAG